MAQAHQKLGQPVNRRLGDLLVADGLLTPAQLQKALGEQRGSTEKLGSILIKLGFINEEQLIGFLSRQDRKSTRLNSSHSQISYAVFCLKKKNTYSRDRAVS